MAGGIELQNIHPILKLFFSRLNINLKTGSFYADQAYPFLP